MMFEDNPSQFILLVVMITRLAAHDSGPVLHSPVNMTV